MPRKRNPPSVTIPLLQRWGACYKPDQLAAVFGRRTKLTALQLCDLRIPPKDRLWVLLRPVFIPEPELHELGLQFAAPALAECGADIQDAVNALLDAKRRFMNNQLSLDELWAAREEFATITQRGVPLALKRCILAAAGSSPRLATYDCARHLRVHWQVTYGLDAVVPVVRRQLRLVRAVLKRLYAVPKAKQA